MFINGVEFRHNIKKSLSWCKIFDIDHGNGYISEYMVTTGKATRLGYDVQLWINGVNVLTGKTFDPSHEKSKFMGTVGLSVLCGITFIPILTIIPYVALKYNGKTANTKQFTFPPPKPGTAGPIIAPPGFATAIMPIPAPENGYALSPYYPTK